ncbi:uncharacterized protein LOC131148507 isoform X2 [Malania oleifera]|uniref:uncharacterized protein LOC131148507 isoform X2 n=1 Tax=Malania oleifera TaxID=397392 RepID=UPI0025ADDF15|nr:uncharacterized protein LOC131148507 isoform X2 [Malania oleifera]XP_057954207.1 uncharacterized protein LOC131148507 isoform X2 [Malania oleifera]
MGDFSASSIHRSRLHDCHGDALIRHRVDSPQSVLDPLLSSMAGLSFTRHPLQDPRGRKITKKGTRTVEDSIPRGSRRSAIASSDFTPPAPIVVKRRRFTTLIDDDDCGMDDGDATPGVARKLWDLLDKVASESADPKEERQGYSIEP